MNRLSARKDLHAPLTPEEIDTTWRAIDDRLNRPAASRTRQRTLAALAIAACFVFVSAALFRAYATPSASAPVMASRLAGPLHTYGSTAPLTVLRASDSGAPIELDDGSKVTLQGPASVVVLENDGTRFALQQSKGRVAYEVMPGGRRRWSIETALGTVEVVGTGFVIDTTDEQLDVSVSHGIVLVRGERVLERVQRLTAGQSFTVHATREAPVVALESLPTAPAIASVSSAKPSDASKARRLARWRDLASNGSYRDAFDALGDGGMAAASAGAPVDDLFVLVDVARLSGHPADALAPLRRILRDHANDPRAPLAAFTLGRVQLDSLGDARAAADAFERAIALGIGDGLREDAHLRRVEALGRAGDTAAASRAARAYVASYPNGEAKVRKWLATP